MEIMRAIPRMDGAAVALGYFDGCHLGHIAVIKAAARDGLPLCVLSVGIPATVTENGLTRETRLVPEPERRAVLESLGVERLITPDFKRLRGMSGEEFFNDILCGRMGARKVACGCDFRFGKNAGCGAEQLAEMAKKRGVECVVCGPVEVGGEKISSTRIRRLLTDGGIAEVNQMLGRSYGYTVKVVGGMKLARQLGTPTINQPLPEDLYPLRRGVYASRVLIDGKWYCSVTNIGIKPTVIGSDERQPISETWILDFSGDLYGVYVRTELLAFIRDEQKFASLDELREAIHRDALIASAVAAE